MSVSYPEQEEHFRKSPVGP